MNKEEMTLEKAEKIVDDMYQKRWKECGVDEGNTIHLGNLDNLKYSELESASIFLLRKEISFRHENTSLKQALNEIREYIKDKQKIQYKFALSHIECNDILQIIDKILGGDNSEK